MACDVRRRDLSAYLRCMRVSAQSEAVVSPGSVRSHLTQPDSTRRPDTLHNSRERRERSARVYVCTADTHPSSFIWRLPCGARGGTSCARKCLGPCPASAHAASCRVCYPPPPHAGKRKRSPFNGPDIPRPANVACGPADRRNRLSNSVDDARPKPGSANGLRGDRTFGLQFRMGGLEL